MKLWVPSIGSMYQRVRASPASVPYSSPTRPWSGNAARIRVRTSRSIAVSAWVTNVPVRLRRDLEIAPEHRSGDLVGLVAGGLCEGQPAVELRLRRGREACAPRRTEPSGSGPGAPGSRPDPLVRRVPERLANRLEPDPLPEDVDLAARPDRQVRRQVGVGDRALRRRSRSRPRSPGRRSGPRRGRARCRGQTDPQVVEDETAQPLPRTGGFAARRASRPMNSASLSSATANPRPASKGVSSGVMSVDQNPVALLEPEGVDGAVAARGQPARPARLHQRVPEGRPELGVGVQLQPSSPT
jgi:hypothetical protein